MMRKLASSVAALSLIAAPQSWAENSPPQNEPVVEALEVRAATPGPAWWKATKGDATAWIIGVPPYTYRNQTWTTSPLRRRLAGADALILPPALPTSPGISAEEWKRRVGWVECFSHNYGLITGTTSAQQAFFGCQRGGGFYSDRFRDESGVRAMDQEAKVSDLPPALKMRVDTRSRIDRGSMRGVELPTAPWSLSAVIFNLNHSLHTRAKLLTKPGEGLVGTLDQAARSARVRPVTVAYDPASANQAFATGPLEPQLACITSLLDLIDLNGRPLIEGLDAWSRGDTVNGLADIGCPQARVGHYGPIALRTAAALESFGSKPGKVVAAVEIAPLLMRGGVLDRLKAAGYTIEGPDPRRDE